jgi:hypothetical protein
MVFEKLNEDISIPSICFFDGSSAIQAYLMKT